jgi:hypothetical protein
MSSPVVTALEKLYSELAKGNLSAAAETLPHNMTFAIAGKSKLAGKYSKETFFSEYFMKLKEIPGGLKMEIHDILASDRHATALLTYNDKIRAVHVWRLENGKPVAGYEYPRDMYQYDSVWN